MRDDIRRNMAESASIFRDLVWPAMSPMMGGGELLPVESTSDRMRDVLDRLAGIDAWQVIDELGVRGIASRVQWVGVGQRPWDTFTVRYALANGYETEFAKRLRAIDHHEHGLLFPHHTVQAYLEGRGDQCVGLLSAAVVDTRILIRHVSSCLTSQAPRCFKRVVAGGNTMVVVPWSHLEAIGVRLGRWSRRQDIAA